MAEQAELSEAAVAALKQKHGADRLTAVTGPDGNTWVVQRPPKSVWAIFTNDAAADKDRAVTLERLALDCIVHPDRATAAAVLSEYPAYAAALSEELGRQAGQGTDLNAKKL